MPLARERAQSLLSLCSPLPLKFKILPSLNPGTHCCGAGKTVS